AFLLLSWSVFSIELSNSQCDYSVKLTSTHPVQYLQYQYYKEAVSCSWTVTSDYKVNLSCSVFELPWSADCFLDRLAVQIGPSAVHRYCGNGTFNIQSESNSMVITLQSPIWSNGGRFFCEVKSLSRPQNPENCSCGRKNPSRIVGGTNVGVNEFPMMCGLVDAQLRIVFCGATIISDRYVLTAAHCIINRDFQYLGVLVGDHDLQTGWGTTDFGGPTSDILQKVTVSVLTNQQCSKTYPNVTTNQICTYAEDKDSCQMDSGGPVLWQNPTTRRLVLIGIISLGRGCAIAAGLNTKVGSYIDWIVS
ncbi:unnamed protein product, partial [Heterotrigona itama]